MKVIITGFMSEDGLTRHQYDFVFNGVLGDVTGFTMKLDRLQEQKRPSVEDDVWPVVETWYDSRHGVTGSMQPSDIVVPDSVVLAAQTRAARFIMSAEYLGLGIS